MSGSRLMRFWKPMYRSSQRRPCSTTYLITLILFFSCRRGKQTSALRHGTPFWAVDSRSNTDPAGVVTLVRYVTFPLMVSALLYFLLWGEKNLVPGATVFGTCSVRVPNEACWYLTGTQTWCGHIVNTEDCHSDSSHAHGRFLFLGLVVITTLLCSVQLLLLLQWNPQNGADSSRCVSGNTTNQHVCLPETTVWHQRT